VGPVRHQGVGVEDARLVVRALPIPALLSDRQGLIVATSRPLATLLGYSPDELAGMPLVRLLPNAGEVTSCVLRSGVVIPVIVRSSELPTSDGPYSIEVVLDERDQLRARAELYVEARTDPLTGVGNRLELENRLEGLAAVSPRIDPQGVVVVLAVDIDEFKAINDEHGHLAGDAVLREIGNRLRQNTRPGDVVARLGGDEFVVVCERASDRPELIADRLLLALNQPIDYEDVPLRATSSVGVAAAAAGSCPPGKMLAAADDSLYQAKRAGRARRGPLVTVVSEGGASAVLR
jgi:diguanylate cyclase (GGDEF)-like protein